MKVHAWIIEGDCGVLLYDWKSWRHIEVFQKLLEVPHEIRSKKYPYMFRSAH